MVARWRAGRRDWAFGWPRAGCRRAPGAFEPPPAAWRRPGVPCWFRDARPGGWSSVASWRGRREDRHGDS